MNRAVTALYPRRHAIVLGACLLAGAVALLWPAIDNGYLFVNIDSGRHLGPGRNFSVAYPPYYNLWLFPLYEWNLAWLVGLAQAGLAVSLIALALRFVARTPSAGALALTVAALAVGTALPFAASTALPDALSAVGLLAIVLAPQSPRGWRAPLAFVAMGSTLVHYSHLPIYAAALGASFGLQAVVRRRAFRMARFREAAAALLLALGVQMGTNWAFYGRASYSISGPVFVLARLQQDGPATWFLREQCPNPAYRLCGVLDQLPAPSDDFLWEEQGAVKQLGDFQELSGEASRVVAGAVRAYPWETARMLWRNSIEQLGLVVAFAVPTRREEWMLEIAAIYPPVLAALESAKQYEDGYWPAGLGKAHERVMAASALLLVPLTALALRRRESRAAAIFALSIAAGYAMNAIVTGGLSRPVARYSGRIAWLIPFAVLVLAFSLARGLRRSGGRG
ncbi:MAG: hypothetical protein GC160_07460 [Acidobacteria bacterium]|nr:hypothetical protein [Acidobacteriota bacterium]